MKAFLHGLIESIPMLFLGMIAGGVVTLYLVQTDPYKVVRVDHLPFAEKDALFTYVWKDGKIVIYTGDVQRSMEIYEKLRAAPAPRDILLPPLPVPPSN